LAQSDQNFVDGPNYLRVLRELDWNHSKTFEERCRAVIEQATGDPVLDLSSLAYLSSPAIKQVARAHIFAEEKGRHLTVRISESLLKIFEVTRLDKVIALEVVRDQGKGKG